MITCYTRHFYLYRYFGMLFFTGLSWYTEDMVRSIFRYGYFANSIQVYFRYIRWIRRLISGAFDISNFLVPSECLIYFYIIIWVFSVFSIFFFKQITVYLPIYLPHIGIPVLPSPLSCIVCVGISDYLFIYFKSFTCEYNIICDVHCTA